MATVGGWKTVDGTRKDFIPITPRSVTHVDVYFDIKAPLHCSQLGNCNNDLIPPVFTGDDITKVGITISIYYKKQICG